MPIAFPACLIENMANSLLIDGREKAEGIDFAREAVPNLAEVNLYI